MLKFSPRIDNLVRTRSVCSIIHALEKQCKAGWISYPIYLKNETMIRPVSISVCNDISAHLPSIVPL